jgi:ketosteroid isomerase-like protein
MENNPMNNETEIRNLIESWAKAVRAREIDGVLAGHTHDMVMFDVPPPVVVKGIELWNSRSEIRTGITSRSVRSLRPNNSFKPTPLRGSGTWLCGQS